MIKKIIFLLLFSIPIFSFSQGLSVVYDSNDKYGFADKNGDTLIECKFDYAAEFSGGLAIVKNNLEYNVIDTAGNLFPIEEYDGSSKFRHSMGEFHSGLPVIVKQWDCAYISSSGEVYLEIPYQDAESFKNGKAKVYKGDKYNYISKNGLLLDDWADDIDDYHTIKNNDKFGYIDRNGKLVIAYSYLLAEDFKDGFAKIGNGTYWAIIDKQGTRISDWYEEIEPYIDDLAIVTKLGNVGFINKKGRFVGSWYEKIEPLDFGMYKVLKYERYAVVNNEGVLATQWFDDVFSFQKGYLKVEKEGKFAYINRIGAMVIGWYDNISNVQNGITTVFDNGKYGFFNVDDFYISEFYDYLGDFNNDIALIKNNGKYGYISKTGYLINIEFDKASPFDGGIAEVEKNNKAAYINTSGEIVMGWLDSKTYFYEDPPRGLIAVKIGRKYGFQTLNGKRAIRPEYDYAENFFNSLALVKNNPTEMLIDKDGNLKQLDAYPDDLSIRLDLGYGHSEDPVKITVWECAYINYDGEIVLELEYNDAFSFTNGKAMVIQGDKYNYIDTKGKIIDNWKEFPDDYHANFSKGKYGFIDKNGIVAIDYKFNGAEDFVDGRAKVRIGSRTTGKFGFINRKGVFITEMYSKVSDFENGVSFVENEDKAAIIDTSGVVLSEWFDGINDFSERYARIKLGDKYSYISIKGDRFDDWFDDAADFCGGLAKIKIGDQWGFVGKSGEIVVRPQYDNVSNYNNNIAKVKKNSKSAFIDMNGKLITDWYDRIYMFSDERAVFCENKKWGYLDINGRVVIQPIYDRAFAFANGEAVVVTGGEMITINKVGQIIEDN